MKRVKFGLVSLWLVLGLGLFCNNVLAYEPCEPLDTGDAYCSGSTLWTCNGERYIAKVCTYGCHNDVCDSTYVCTSGRQRCYNDNVQTCSNNRWSISDDCTSSETCVEGTNYTASCNSTYYYYNSDTRACVSVLATSASACFSTYGSVCYSSSTTCASANSCKTLNGTCRTSCLSSESINGNGSGECSPAVCCVKKVVIDGCGGANGKSFSSLSALNSYNQFCLWGSNTYVDNVVAIGGGEDTYTQSQSIPDGGFIIGWSWDCPAAGGGYYICRASYSGAVKCVNLNSQANNCLPSERCNDKPLLGQASDCTVNGSVCCIEPKLPGCESKPDPNAYCKTNYGNCYYCDDGVSYGSACKSSYSSGARGVVGTANDSSLCSISSSTTGLCSTTYGTTITDSVGSDGTFNWSCTGQSASTCRSAGVGVSGVATKLPVVNGDCGTVNGSCNAGTAAGVGTTQIVSGGINDVWSCGGSCGGASDSCDAVKCTNQPVVNGGCNSNVLGTSASDLCARGTPTYVDSEDSNHDYYVDGLDDSKYVWMCVGSTNTCAEGNGSNSGTCYSTIDQDNWFQVTDGNILASKVVNYVPVTTRSGGSVNLESTVKNGRVYTKSSSSFSDFDSAEKKSSSNYTFSTYSYEVLKKDYFLTRGVGTTFADGVAWSTVKNTTGVIFVDGDLNITGENLVTTNFVMIIAKGTITIDPSVTEIDAILVANNKVVAAATEDGSTQNVNQLVIKGMVHGVNGVEFSRSLYDSSLGSPASVNNTTPSVLVSYEPDLLFMVPQSLTKAFSQWKVN